MKSISNISYSKLGFRKYRIDCCVKNIGTNYNHYISIYNKVFFFYLLIKKINCNTYLDAQNKYQEITKIFTKLENEIL